MNIIVKGWGLQACSYICDKQSCSQGQNPKAKDEAKAWTLEAKTKDTHLCPEDPPGQSLSSRTTSLFNL